ncbi:putative beta-glucosidase [Cryomyces antarcticus]
MPSLRIAATLLAGAALGSAQLNGTAPFPNSTYANASDPNTAAGAQSFRTSPPFYPSPWMDGSGGWAAAYQKAQAFVSQLTLIEKVNLTTGVGWEEEQCVGNVGAIPRLGFRSLCMQDSPVGVRLTDFNSVFPAGGTIAATWDRGLFYQRGYEMGMEHRNKGVDVQLGPVVGPLGRSPEAGRNWEGFSPDPVLSGIAVGETVRGIQAAGVIACTKHFIGNEQEHFRQQGEAAGYGFNISDSISANIDDVTMHELYLWPFADAVRAGTGAIMCSYNQINNSYGCQNSHTLNYLLKGELGFQGFVMSDWQAQHSGVGSALAGMDMSMPGDTVFGTGRSYWGTNLTVAILNGTVPQWRLDDMATRIVAAWYYVGRDQINIPTNFDSWTTNTFGYRHALVGQGYEQVNYHVDVRDEHTIDIRNMASRSTVLLKNVNNVLPLSGKEKLTGVLGEDAGENTYGPNGCGDRGCDNGTLGMAWGSGTANFPFLITPLTAIQNELVANNAAVESVTDNWAASQIEALASRVNDVEGVAIVFVNSDSGEGYISVDGNEGDRNNLTLWQNGDTLISNVSSLCNNTVVVVHSTGPVLLGAYANNPNVTAILWAGVPGEQSGNSIADILYGRVNPGAKLPFTLGSTREEYGTDLLYQPNNGAGAPQDDFTEGVFIDYRHFDRAGITPVYEFGFGLSYTTFTVSNMQISSHAAGAYTATSGMTSAAPTLGGNDSSTAYADVLFPANITRVPLYIYPYLNSSDPAASTSESDYGALASSFVPAGATNGSPQPRIAAGGAPGGNPELYDVLFTVTATISNTGKIAGEEVPQLYLNLGGPNDPKVVLRNFERLSIQPGTSATFTADITRRDVSSWDTVSQNWVITKYPKTAYVGTSSRSLSLSMAVPL